MGTNTEVRVHLEVVDPNVEAIGADHHRDYRGVEAVPLGVEAQEGALHHLGMDRKVQEEELHPEEVEVDPLEGAVEAAEVEAEEVVEEEVDLAVAEERDDLKSLINNSLFIQKS